jgi:hypothetical protein
MIQLVICQVFFNGYSSMVSNVGSARGADRLGNAPDILPIPLCDVESIPRKGKTEFFKVQIHRITLLR